MTEAAIDTGLFRDLYVALGEPLDNEAWVVRVYHKPFVDWIWFGCILMALGGALAISDRRYRLSVRKKRETSETIEEKPASAAVDTSTTSIDANASIVPEGRKA